MLPQTSLANAVWHHASATPHKAAFLTADKRMSWAQYCDWSDHLAGVLVRAGYRRRDRIGIFLADDCETHLAYLACQKAGLTAVAPSSRAGRREIVYLMERAGAVGALGTGTDGMADGLLPAPNPRPHISVALGDGGIDIRVDGVAAANRSLAHERNEPEPRMASSDDLFLLNTTSGTTGLPKLVRQTERRWLHWMRYVEDSASLGPEDIFLCAVPASTGFGLWSGHFVPSLLGASTVLLPKFSVGDMLRQIERWRVTALSAVSTQFIMMLQAPDLADFDLGSLRVLYTGGERVPYDLAARFEDRFGVPVLQFYGSNEAGAISYTSAADSREKRLKTAGRIVPDIAIRLLDGQGHDATAQGRGQPVVRSPTASSGYENDAEANGRLFTADGWMKIDDIVEIDADGYLRVVGRVGDFIIRGGKNISAAAVEEAVMRYPGVTRAAAVAMPDPVFGERVCVYATQAAGATIDCAGLTEFLRADGVSTECFPERLIVLDELPLASGGKVCKRTLKAMLS